MKKYHIACGFGVNSAKILSFDDLTFEEFANFCSKPLKGKKHEWWFTRGGDFVYLEEYVTKTTKIKYGPGYYKNDENLNSADFILIDGDCSIDGSNAPEPKLIHKALKYLKINHFIYTTHSHNPPETNKFRVVVPCYMNSKHQLKPTIKKLMTELNQFASVKLVKEMNVWSQYWFLPTRDDPEDDKFEFYSFFDGNDYKSVSESKEEETKQKSESSTTFEDHYIAFMETGEGHTHYAPMCQSLANEGFNVEKIIRRMAPICKQAFKLHGREWSENRDQNLREAAESAVNKIDNENDKKSDSNPYLIDTDEIDSKYTNLPEYKGGLKIITDEIMKLTRYPNRNISQFCAEHIVSVFGGGHYSLMKNTTTRKRIALGMQGSGKNTITRVMDAAFLGLERSKAGVPLINCVREHYEGDQSYSYINQHKNIETFRIRSFIVNEAGEGAKSKSGDLGTLSQYHHQVLSLKSNNSFSPKKYSEISTDPKRQPKTVYGGVWVMFHESVPESYTEKLQTANSFGSGDASRSDFLFINPYIDLSKVNINPDIDFSNTVITMLAVLGRDFAKLNKEKGTDATCIYSWEEIDYSEIEHDLIELEHKIILERNKSSENGDAFANSLLVRKFEKILSTILIQSLADSAVEIKLDGNLPKPIATKEHLEIAIKRQNSIDTCLEFNHISGELAPLMDKVISSIEKSLKRLRYKENNKTAERLDCAWIKGNYVINRKMLTKWMNFTECKNLTERIFSGDSNKSKKAIIAELQDRGILTPVVENKWAEVRDWNVSKELIPWVK